ncbi:MAG TPA: hypothetical protein PLE99_13515 [Candidatus Thiothrix moscowensis]|uniref:hypothetical protein n=1 Tax=unclassified Thiothrix TaxID=2636184 RepID=UPI0025E615B0|nr:MULTISPECIES: hypothetical protein [unclassified Thiothrix]HRJ53779.1 hypothetical protein [Candidatus Thiothrix moscowensis]HRJ93861.1 hypothetical protein [Candidatus Thiothrix moscowensis]
MLTKVHGYLWGVYLSVLLAGCGGMTAEKDVAEAAQKRWEYLIAGNLEQAYHYYTDAFKQATPYEHFRNNVRGTGLWNRATVETVKCDDSASRCTVTLDVTVSMKMRGLSKPVESSDRVAEVWVKEGWFSDWRYIKE